MEYFSAGKALQLGFRVWFRNLPSFLAIVTIVHLPYILWGVMVVQGDDTSFSGLLTFAQLSPLAVMILSLFASAAVCYGVVMELSGQRASIGECVATGLARFFPVLGVAFLSALATIGGFILLVIPGFLVLCALYVSPVVAVLERPGVRASLQRSRELTSGRRWSVFGLLFVLGVLGAAAQKLLQLMLFDESKLTRENVHQMVRTFIYADLARSVIASSISSVMVAVTYYLLRSEKEGTSATELGQVFE